MNLWETILEKSCEINRENLYGTLCIQALLEVKELFPDNKNDCALHFIGHV